MPTGIPPSVSTLASSVQEQLTAFLTYLQIPSYNATSTQFQVALRDSVLASRSIYQFLQLTTRPLFILLALLSKYIIIVLRILSEHTVYHGIRAGKEMWRQTKIACLWFVDFQKGLSKTVICMEIGFVGLCVGLYMIRRYLQRKKYFQKLKRWYTAKRNKLQLKYNNFVDSVAQTSQILALLLPHILYGIMTLTLKYFTPSVIHYLANNTILSDVISFYIPFVRTVAVVYKFKNVCSIAEEERMESLKVRNKIKGTHNNNEDDNTWSKTTSRKGLLSFFSSTGSLASSSSNTSSKSDKKNNISSSSSIRKKGKSRVADAYKKAVNQGSNNSNNNNNHNISVNTNSDKKLQQQKVKITPTILHNDELNDLSREAAELLKYWIVYAILTALIQTATLLPILGRVFYNANPINAKKAAASMKRWSSKHKNRVSWLDKIKLSTGLLEEFKLFFFAWLLLLPTSLTSTSTKSSSDGSFTASKSGSSGSNDIKNRIKALEKKAKYASSTQKSNSIRRKTLNTEAPFSNQPLDIVYVRLAPIVISLVSTSTNIVNDTSNGSDNSNSVSGDVNDPLQAFKAKCTTFSRTVLEAMVWTKIISESTKNLIINTFRQCTSILPAAVTMFMPSYFTNYGIIYVRLIVPSANSSSSYDAFIALHQNLGAENIIDANGLVNERWINAASNINRFLQFWVIQGIVAAIVMSFAPVLAWIPLSTHMTWLLWAYVQLESTTMKLYNILARDLVAFGILKKSESILNGDKHLGDETKAIDVNETTIMQLLKRVPTNPLTSDLKESKSKNTNLDDQECSDTTSKSMSTSAEGRKDVSLNELSIDDNNVANDVKGSTSTVNQTEASRKSSENDGEVVIENTEECAANKIKGDVDSNETIDETIGAKTTNDNLIKGASEVNEDYVCVSSRSTNDDKLNSQG